MDLVIGPNGWGTCLSEECGIRRERLRKKTPKGWFGKEVRMESLEKLKEGKCVRKTKEQERGWTDVMCFLWGCAMEVTRGTVVEHNFLSP